MGALVGTAVTVRLRGRNPEADTWLFNARWMLLGAAVGVLFAAADWLGLLW